MKHALTLSLFLYLISGCKMSDDSVFSLKGDLEKKGQSAGALSNTFDKPQKAVEASYVISLTSSASSNPICSGETSITIMSDFSFDFPAGKVICGALAIDVSSILRAFQTNLSDTTKKSKFSSDGKLLYIDQFGDSVFVPSRPMLLGPIVQDVSIYENFNQTTAHTLTYLSATGIEQTAQGTITVKVSAIDSSYTAPALKEPLNKVIKWQMDTAGFQGVPIASSGLLDRMEFFWNARPMMLPYLKLQGSFGNFISFPGPIGDLANSILGPVTIELAVKDYTRY
jgi:hypothetical protein